LLPRRYYFSNPKPQDYYNYGLLVAGNLLHGAIGFRKHHYLAERVRSFEGYYYSARSEPLSLIPFALLAAIGIIHEMPGEFTPQ
jgi:hypothetical protein